MIDLEIDGVVVHTVDNTDELIIKDSSLTEGLKEDLERRYRLKGVVAIESKIKNCLQRMKDKYKDIPFVSKDDFVAKVIALSDYCDRDTREIPEEERLPDSEQRQYLIKNLTQAIKLECGRRIKVEYPGWKQRNCIASTIRILQKESVAFKANSSYVLSQADLDSLRVAETMDNDILYLRSKSDTLENSLSDLTLSELKAFNPNDSSHW